MEKIISNHDVQTTPFLNWVTPSQLEQIHNASLEVLARTGMLVKHKRR